MKALISLTLLVFLAAPGAWAQKKSRKALPKQEQAKTINMNSQLDGLGRNEEIIKKAQALQPNNNMRIVQKREVDRNWRGELGVSYGMVNGGDSYVNTANWGLSADLHISPRWSLGVRYIENKNELTAEGDRVTRIAADKQAKGETDYIRPDIDFAKRTILALVNWYPIYGKVSWLEYGVSQFDFYVLAGGGQIQLSNTTSPIYTGGAGMGIWWNNRITTRLEVRYQNYKDQVFTGERNINSFVGQIGIGLML